MIDKWTAVYPPHQFLVVSQEAALLHPRGAYDATLKHIGVSRDYDATKIKLLRAETNLGPKVEMPKEIGDYLEAMFAGERQRLYKILGGRISVYDDRRPPATVPEPIEGQ